MYFLGLLNSARSAAGRRAFGRVADSLAQETTKKKLFIGWDMIRSLLQYGSSFEEYYNLRFYERSHQNRGTFITTYYNLRRYHRMYFLDKRLFNQKFHAYIRRDWVDLENPADDLLAFFKKHPQAVIKPKQGDSGKGVCLVTLPEPVTQEDVLTLKETYKGALAEEVLRNHPDLRRINPTSLNTMRIITVAGPKGMEILYAGLRVGAAGEVVDNISKGGSVAAIDASTGQVVSGLFCKATCKTDRTLTGDAVVGLRIPCWTQVIEMLAGAAGELPQMRYMAWDVAVTQTGPALIEGNHTSGNAVIQLHCGLDQEGLKPRMEEILKKVGISE